MKKIPMVEGSRIKIIRELIKDRIVFYHKMRRKYGDVFSMPIFGNMTYITDPKIIKHMLHDNYANYLKPNADQHPAVKEVVSITGNDKNLLFTADMEFWRENRKAATKSFLQTSLAEYVPRIVSFTKDIAKQFDKAENQKQPAQMDLAMGILTLRNMLYNLYQDADVNFDEFHHEMNRMLEQLEKRAFSISKIRWLLPTADRKEHRESYSYIYEAGKKIVEQRFKSDKPYDDLQNNLIEAFKDKFSEDELKENLTSDLIVYLIAGHDTTASTLNATFQYLSLYPDIEKKVLDEIEDVVGSDEITFEKVNLLMFTKMVFQESLRLQTPIASFPRIVQETEEVDGYVFEKGSNVQLLYTVVNRHPDYWDNPEAFDPERFREKRWGQDEQYAYLPFGGGPRMCIGMNFAYMEAVIALAYLLPRYRFTLLPGLVRKLKPSATIWPQGAEQMMVERRK